MSFISVTSDSIRELRVFSTVEELREAAKPVVLSIRRHQPPEPRVFLAILAGDGGFRGCFFPDDLQNHQNLDELAQQTGLIVVDRITEKQLMS